MPPHRRRKVREETKATLAVKLRGVGLYPLSHLLKLTVVLGSAKLTAGYYYCSKEVETKAFISSIKKEGTEYRTQMTTLSITVSGLPRCNCNSVYLVTEEVNQWCWGDVNSGSPQVQRAGNWPPGASGHEPVPGHPVYKVQLPFRSHQVKALWRPPLVTASRLQTFSIIE